MDNISTASERFQSDLKRFYNWAAELESEGLAILTTYQSENTVNLQVRLPQVQNRPALITINNDTKLNRAFVRFYLTQMDKYAIQSISLLEELTGLDFSVTEKKGNTTKSIIDINDEILTALYEAYREANGLPVGEEGGSEEPPQLDE